MKSASLLRVVPNSEIHWAGGFPCGITESGVVHAITQATMMSERFVCGSAYCEARWTKKPLTCKRCAAVINREMKERGDA